MRDLEDPIGPALSYLAARQGEEGSWRGDYGGPLFLLPLYVAAADIVGIELDAPTRTGMIRYFENHQNPDGGFGLSVEAPSYVFTTAVGYVALRLLGRGPDEAGPRRARAWLLARGGANGAATWGKLMLALLGLYEYDGLHPILPELWLLPQALPIHPSRYWCHTRMVYLPMAWLYARRARRPRDGRIEALRREIHAEPYDRIDWRACRDLVAPTDRDVPRSWLLRAAGPLLDAYERFHSRALRRRALARVLDHIRYEDRATGYVCLGPINKLLNLLVWHFERPGGPEVAAHVARLPDYLWRAGDGIKMQGYQSSELWDTAFAVQAVAATGRGREHAAMLERAHRFIDANQVLADLPERERFHRDPTRGAWPFSRASQGWTVSDCTAEALKAVLALEPLAGVASPPLSEERLRAAADLILSVQNRDGGFAPYERTRGPRWLELLNPSDVFQDIMIDRSHVECTSSCVQALAAFRGRFPAHRRADVDAAIGRGRDFILRAQRPDGSWEGFWGVCFTYGAWFGVLGLRAAGLPAEHPAIEAARRFLLSKQLADGGWGETVESCRQRRYVHAEGGQAVMTSWAVLALIRAGRAHTEAVERGLAFLERRQRPDGSWPAEHLAGVFNRTVAIHYDNYLKIFPLWALALGRGERAARERPDRAAACAGASPAASSGGRSGTG